MVDRQSESGLNHQPDSSDASENTIGLLIVGAGLSGLTLASRWRRNHPDGQLRIVEAASRTGGVIHTENVGDFVVDHGADMFATQPPAALEFCRELGVESQLLLPRTDRRGAMIVRRGRLEPIPEGFVLMRATQTAPMLRTPILSPLQKIRFLAERWVPKRGDDQDESVAQFVRRRMGRGVLDRLVAPLVAGIYTADIERLSMQATMGPIWAMESEFGSLYHAAKKRQGTGQDQAERHSAGARYGNFRGFPGGMIDLISTIESSVGPERIQTASPVTRLERTGSNDAWKVHMDGGEDFSARQVVLATPARTTAKLLENVSPAAAQNLAAIESASAAIVVMGVRRDQISHPINMFGFVVPPKENRRILAGSFASHKFDGRAPDDHVLIRVFIGGVLQKHLLAHDDDQLITIAREELASLIGLSGRPIITKVVRWNDAMPQYNLGHLERVEAIDSALAQVDGLHVLGNWKGGVGISPLVGSAIGMADSMP